MPCLLLCRVGPECVCCCPNQGQSHWRHCSQDSKLPFPRGWDGRGTASWDAPQRSSSPGGGGSNGAWGVGEADGVGGDSLPAMPPPPPFLPPHLRGSSGSTDAAFDALGGGHRGSHGWRSRDWGSEPPSERGAWTFPQNNSQSPH